MKLKVFISLLIAVVLSFLISCPAFASANYDSNTDVTLSLNYSTNGASCYAKIKGGSGTTSITNGEMVLTDSNLNVVKRWNGYSTNGTTLIISGTARNVTAGETYTLTVTATVNSALSSQNITESITVTY